MSELPLPTVKLNGDSSVKDVSYAAGWAECRWEDWDGRVYRLRARTDTFVSAAAAEHGTVHLEIDELANCLLVHEASGRYCIPPDFGQQMKLVRQGCHLALGRNHHEWPYLLRISGHHLLLACPLRAKEDVTLLPID